MFQSSTICGGCGGLLGQTETYIYIYIYISVDAVEGFLAKPGHIHIYMYIDI